MKFNINTTSNKLFQKKSKQRGWGHGTSRDIEEKACGNSRGEPKKKWNFQGCSRKTHMEFSWVLAECHTILQNFQGCKKLAFSGISKGKVTNLKILGSFVRKVYPQLPLPVWMFSGISQFNSIIYVFLCYKILLHVLTYW